MRRGWRWYTAEGWNIYRKGGEMMLGGMGMRKKRKGRQRKAERGREDEEESRGEDEEEG